MRLVYTAIVGGALVTSEVLDGLSEPGWRFALGLVLVLQAIFAGADAETVERLRREP